jgi:hypothetical protein
VLRPFLKIKMVSTRSSDPCRPSSRAHVPTVAVTDGERKCRKAPPAWGRWTSKLLPTTGMASTGRVRDGCPELPAPGPCPIDLTLQKRTVGVMDVEALGLSG